MGEAITLAMPAMIYMEAIKIAMPAMIYMEAITIAMPAMIYMEAITIAMPAMIYMEAITMAAVTQASAEYLKCCRLTCIARGVIGLSLVVASVFFLYIRCTSRDQSAQHDKGGV